MMGIVRRSVLSGSLLLLVAQAGLGQSWPEFRGPTGQGIFAQGGLPLEWGPTTNVAWKQAIPGKGWSSPILHGGRIFLTTSVPVGPETPKDESLRVLALDANTGKVRWQTEVFLQNGATAPRVHTKNSHASPTPLTDGERLYVHFGHQGTACLDLDGKVLWRNQSLRYKPVHGNGGSPILVDELLVFSCDGGDQQFVVALDRKSGQVVWKTNRQSPAFKKFSFNTPLLITVNGQRQIVSVGSDVICAYEPVTGKELWRVMSDGYSVVPRPVFGQGLVFICSGYDRPTLLAIRPGNGKDREPEVVWRTTRNVPHSASPLLVGEELYLVSDMGIATCTTARTGQVVWQERLGGSYSASPLYADGKIYFQDEDGVATVIKAGQQFERLARNALEERTLASYAAAPGVLFIRTDKHLYRIETKK